MENIVTKIEEKDNTTLKYKKDLFPLPPKGRVYMLKNKILSRSGNMTAAVQI